MKKLSLKGKITLGAISGMFFAGMMAGFDYLDHKPFNVVKFLLNTFFMGLFNGLFFGKSKPKDESPS
ncbi:hypothetical protein [Lacinutrix undariae]